MLSYIHTTHTLSSFPISDGLPAISDHFSFSSGSYITVFTAYTVVSSLATVLTVYSSGLDALVVFIYSLFLIIVICVIILISFFFSPTANSFAKYASYECGFEPVGDAHDHFNIHFYIVGVLFLIFDLELAIMYPWVFSFIKSPVFFFLDFFCGLVFLFLLAVGFIYEWSVGALDWVPLRLIKSKPRQALISS